MKREFVYEYFHRAWRTEVGSSLTAVSFYRKGAMNSKMESRTPMNTALYGWKSERKRSAAASLPQFVSGSSVTVIFSTAGGAWLDIRCFDRCAGDFGIDKLLNIKEK